VVAAPARNSGLSAQSLRALIVGTATSQCRKLPLLLGGIRAAKFVELGRILDAARAEAIDQLQRFKKLDRAQIAHVGLRLPSGSDHEFAPHLECGGQT